MTRQQRRPSSQRTHAIARRCRIIASLPSTGSVYPTWGEGGPEGAVFAANKSGYFDTDKYTKWFQEVGEKFNI